MSRSHARTPPPAPPVPLSPARTLYAPGRGDLFLRDTGGGRPRGRRVEASELAPRLGEVVKPAFSERLLEAVAAVAAGESAPVERAAAGLP